MTVDEAKKKTRKFVLDNLLETSEYSDEVSWPRMLL